MDMVFIQQLEIMLTGYRHLMTAPAMEQEKHSPPSKEPLKILSFMKKKEYCIFFIEDHVFKGFFHALFFTNFFL